MNCPRCHQEHTEGTACPPPPEAAGSDPLLGTALGDYSLVRELGRGSTGVVYLAEHLATGLQVAIKVVHRHLLGDRVLARQMAREARFANQIALDTVVNVFDFSDEDPLGSYLVMEHLQGETLLDVASQRLPADEALALLSQVADALGEAHRRNIVHAALKPSNIFRTTTDSKQNLAKLLPFGVPTGPAEPDEEPGDRAVALLGSPEFRAPEQTLGAPPDPRMDVYCLGAIAYLLATGRVPFTAPTPQALERAHAEVVPAPPHRVNPRISRGWSAAIMRALEKSPERRFLNGSELAQAFRAAPAEPDPVATTTARFVLEAPAGKSEPIAGGLSEGFVVADPPRPAQVAAAAAPASIGGGLADGVVVTNAQVAPPAAPASIGSGLADGFVVTTPAPPTRVATPPGATASVDRRPAGPGAAPQPSAPTGLAEEAPSQGLVLRAAITDERAQPLGDFVCSSVTRAGLIVCTPGPLPALLSRVKLTFADLDGLTCDAQVVHHLSADQAAQWKVSPGYGVQFGTLTPEQRARLEGAHQGLRPPETASGIARRPDDPAATEVLKRFSAERAADGYGMLSISKAAPFDAIRDRVRDAKRVLEGLAGRPLSLAQQQAFEEARLRLDQVGQTLSNAMSRVEFDAERGNFEGVARCISAGISVAEIEEVRLRFLKTHPGIAGKSHGSILAGQTLEARQQMPLALETYAEALRSDPLNLTAQQRYWAVRRQLDKS